MNKDIFSSFKEASSFAKNESLSKKVLHTVKKRGNKWEVFSKGMKHKQIPISQEESELINTILKLEKRLKTLKIIHEDGRRKEERKAELEAQKEVKARDKKRREKKREERKAELEAQKKAKARDKKRREKKREERKAELEAQKKARALEKQRKERDERRRRKKEKKEWEKILKREQDLEIKKINYLKQKKEYYLSLSEDNLDYLWAGSNKIKLEEEKILLRAVLRIVKGYQVDMDGIPVFCSTCGKQRLGGGACPHCGGRKSW